MCLFEKVKNISLTTFTLAGIIENVLSFVLSESQLGQLDVIGPDSAIALFALQLAFPLNDFNSLSSFARIEFISAYIKSIGSRRNSSIE